MKSLKASFRKMISKHKANPSLESPKLMRSVVFDRRSGFMKKGENTPPPPHTHTHKTKQTKTPEIDFKPKLPFGASSAFIGDDLGRGKGTESEGRFCYLLQCLNDLVP